jgi:hypothetical protein
MQRHKDRNSFKFSNTPLILEATLPELYQATLQVKVECGTSSLSASYPLSQLRVGETTWLILNLSNSPNPPTLRLQLTLVGPYRPEVDAVVKLAHGWSRFVASLETHKAGVGVMAILLLPLTLLLLPAVLVTQHSDALLRPLGQTLLSTPSGQRLVYDLGPRPSPVAVVKPLLPTDVWNKLWLSLLLDTVGSASYLVPLVGEVTDILWAPLQTIIIMALYEQPQWKYISLAEELLPLTDIVPTATLGWMVECGLPMLQAQGGSQELALKQE